MNKGALIFVVVCGLVCIAMPVRAQDITGPEAAAPVVGEEETDIVAGKVTAVDATNKTVTVTDEAGKSYTLTATKEETSIWKGDNTIELADLKVDDSVELEYYKAADGKLVAIWIDVLTKEAAIPVEAAPETTSAPAQ
ncbi:MAG: DUF5666 domain-containing protein [Candidatus Omnitrophica bacterium]|nr:DUF5666 domain-containing protein [Candidatus Omnitrophota bacterium]